MDGASGAVFLCVSCGRCVSDQAVVQAYGADVSVSSGDEMSPTSVHGETGAGVETEYTADELPAGESQSIYYDCDWSDYLSAEPSDANTMDVKAHLLCCHPVHCIRNIGALSNTDCALMESHHIMTKADGSMTSIHTQLLQIMAVQQRR